ncbi:unnamed protein product [Staurois parvus]|uniref:Uncharacterized protein n=1 Tax=Staurois parvus TaxID=386267 RepID=A0ABN9GQC3_9NEOB|nr:unnamed protein product [Staurois parvus]
MVGVTSQGSEQSQQRSGSNRVSNKTGTGTGLQKQDTGPRKKHTPRQSLQVWPSLKYTSISSFRCLTGCKVESLIAGSTRWPALVLQPIRQVSPTIAGQSIPDRKF